MIIEIFGLGCENCELLKNNVQRAVDALNIKAQIIKVEDFEMIIRKGITMTPGLVIDGEIRSMGRVPSVEEIKEIIETTGGGITVCL
jgi:small redox-active disulfide protein 2